MEMISWKHLMSMTNTRSERAMGPKKMTKPNAPIMIKVKIPLIHHFLQRLSILPRITPSGPLLSVSYTEIVTKGRGVCVWVMVT